MTDNDEGLNEVPESAPVDAENRPASTAAGSPAGSKAASARSKSRGSPTQKSPKASKASSGRSSPAKSSRERSARERSGEKRSARSRKSDKRSSVAPETPTFEQRGLDTLPDGCLPIFLSGPTQQIFNLVADEDVTPTAPMKLIKKEDILQDFHKRAAVSDFSVAKDIISNYPGEELLVIYDFEFKFGENFVLATTEEAKEVVLTPPKKEGEGEEGEEEEPEDDVVHRYIPPESKPWVSLGSELEIEAEKVEDSRPRIKTLFCRERRSFGAPVNFTDRNVAQAKSGCIDIVSTEDRSFDMPITLKDKNESSVPRFLDEGTQTDWRYPVNAHTQYEFREFTEEQKKEHLESEALKTSAEDSLSLFIESLQHNEIMNYFFDDYTNLSEGDSTFDSRADNTLKEYQSFTDLKFSKDKAVTHIDWHPTIKGLVAMSLGEKMTFDQRVENSAKVVMHPSLIILWNFADPIQPQLLLEAPDDILCFQFCPSDPHIVAGGCINGQVVLWDIEKHVEELKSVKNKMKSRNQKSFLPGFDDDSSMKVPIMRYCAVSGIEQSHQGPITDLMWVPDHFEVNRMGYPIQTKENKCIQLMTCAIDHSINFWDIRAPKGPTIPDKFRDAQKHPMGVPETFRYLDLKWKPHLKVHLFKSEPGGDHAPSKFSIFEVQGDRSILSTLTEESKENAAPAAQFGKPGSAQQRTLDKMVTNFYVGTEDGELVYVDWIPQKDQDTGKVQTMKPEFYNALHDGPVVALQRCPFDRKIILVVGGWMWSLWKEGINSGPIISSCSAVKPLTCGAWSPSRPSIFFITRSDGCIEVWDLLDKTHEPILVQNVASSALTIIRPWNVNSRQQLLGVGDANGTLHVYQVPNRLKQAGANEPSLIGGAIEREVKRRHFVVARWDMREKEKIEKEQEAKRAAGIAPAVVLSEEEIIAKMKMEYDAFIEEESAFLRELGIKDDDEPLPAVD